MKILMLIDSLGSGGAQRQMALLARGLVERGHDVSIANYYPHLNHFRPELSKICTIIDIPKKNRWSIGPALSIRRILKKSSPDILLSFLDTPNIYSILAGIGIKSTKVVVSERFTFKKDTPDFAEKVRYMFYQGADAITVNSEHQRNNIEISFPSLSHKVFRIYNGVDLERFFPPKDYIRTDNSSLRLLAVASIVAKKNPVNLINALAIAKNNGLDVTIDWAGKKCLTHKGKDLFNECEALIAQQGLINSWNWIGERNDIPELLQKYDALIHPSYKEGFPNAICEALASGLPVLASNVCDHPYLIEQGVTGFLYDPDNPSAIYDAISNLYHLTDDKIIKMRSSSRAYAEANLKRQKLAGQYEKLFHRIS